jgi:hypothetical protein
MTRIVKRDGLTIEINPIPRGKLLIGKRPEGGILTCDRCGRQEANVERNENGWELWHVLQRYTDLCPACVPVVTNHSCGRLGIFPRALRPDLSGRSSREIEWRESWIWI